MVNIYVKQLLKTSQQTHYSIDRILLTAMKKNPSLEFQSRIYSSATSRRWNDALVCR